MNKIFSVAAIVALLTTLSFAELSLGARAAISGQSVNENVPETEKDYGFGYGGGLGLAAFIHFNESFALRTGAEFYWREIYNQEIMSVEASASEFAISIPVLFSYSFMKDIYAGLGMQADIPIAPKLTVDGKSMDFKDRSAVDLGVIIGSGFSLTENILIDIRGTIYLTKVTTIDDEDNSLVSASMGFTYLF